MDELLDWLALDTGFKHLVDNIKRHVPPLEVVPDFRLGSANHRLVVVSIVLTSLDSYSHKVEGRRRELAVDMILLVLCAVVFRNALDCSHGLVWKVEVVLLAYHRLQVRVFSIKGCGGGHANWNKLTRG